MRQEALDAAGVRSAPILPDWLPVAVLLGVTALVGPALGGAARPLFIVGCGAVGWATWHRGPAVHLRALLVLFAFAPFLRRLVDVTAGFDEKGVMLVGPLFAALAAAPELLRPADGRRAERSAGLTAPLLLVGGCVCYAAMISLFQGDFLVTVSSGLKWITPLIYAAVLVRCRPSSADLLSATASAFLIIIPVMGLYGVFQYVDPPEWDRYWMQNAKILSAGEPIPFGVRTFSTMNGPASFATFTAAGLLVICLLRSGWRALLCAAPAVPALLLSSYRTAWISLLAGIVFCCFFGATRRRALTTILGGVLAIGLTALLTPFGDAIGDRFASFGSGAQDGSAQERLAEFATLWGQWDSGLIGRGFTITDVGSAGTMAVDGMIVACWVTMGIVVGLLTLAGFGWAIANALAAPFRDGRREFVLVGALACGALTQIPLADIGSGELGFLFWIFAILLPPAAVQKAVGR